MSENSEYAALAPFYDLFIDWKKRLELELPFILDTVPEPRDGLRCLDIGCGTGRHLERLRMAGMEVEGAEPSPALRSQAEHNLPGAAIHSHPMEQLNELAEARGPWNLVICLGNTLAHLPPELRAGFFSALTAAIAPGGKAVLHLLGYDRIMRQRPDDLPEKVVIHNGNRYVFRRYYDYLDNRIVFSLRITIDDRPVGEQRETLYPLEGETLREYLAVSGITDVEMFDGFDRNRTYTADSANLVCVFSM